jgi:RHS repeat-associated protein
LIRYDHGPDRLLAETEFAQTRTWLIDGLRTPVKRLNDDGTTYSQTVYDEYGQVESELSPDIPRFGFTGHQRGPAEDPDLYYAQQRYYNAATGRFVSEDPLWGGPATPLSLHRYLYAYANPTVYIDPDGRMGMPNFWSEMPGYVAPETNELHYIDGSPELKSAAFAALTPGQRAEFAGARLGMLQNIGQLPVDMVFGMAAMVNAGVDLASGGRLYGGSARQVAEGFESTGRFLRNPLENTREYFQDLEDQSQWLRDQGRLFEAGQVGAQGVFSIVEGGFAIAGTGSLVASATKVGAETARNTVSQLGREVIGSPTAFYVQESTTSFILELWRGDFPPARSQGVDIELRFMRRPQGGIRLRGMKGRIESVSQSVRRQLGSQASDAIGFSSTVPDSLRRFDEIKRTRDTSDAQKTRSDAFEAVRESLDWFRVIGKILRDSNSDSGGG